MGQYGDGEYGAVKMRGIIGAAEMKGIISAEVCA